MLDIHFAAGGRVSFGLTAVVIFTQYVWSTDFIKGPADMVQVQIFFIKRNTTYTISIMHVLLLHFC